LRCFHAIYYNYRIRCASLGNHDRGRTVTEFYAHTLETSPDPADWQRLQTHLSETANLAQHFTKAFDSSDWGYIAGLWHDLGKYHPDFQRRLRGERIAIEHSGAGAALAFSKHEELGTFLGFIIAGHHAGLANYIQSGPGLPSPLKERLRCNRDSLGGLLENVPIFIREQTVPSLPGFLLARPDVPTGVQRRKIEFWIRFLFSALIDADRLNTQSFCDPDKAKLRGEFASITELRERLDTAIDNKIEDVSLEARFTTLNLARSEVLNACREAASEKSGFFSLTVPTGGGKTLSAMSFALRHAECHALRRVIVVIPYTSIIEQNAEVYREALGTENIVEHHSNLDFDSQVQRQGAEVTLQHQLAAENWDAPIIVTTTVQFFESLFSNRTSRCRKLHNIARSVIILDEVQTLRREYLQSILDALKQLVLNYGCSVVLSTATPPALAKRDRFNEGIDFIHPIIKEPEILYKLLERVDYEWPDLDAPAVEWQTLAVDVANETRILAIVHRRDDACALARLVAELKQDDPIYHLSALMCPAHRLKVLEKIREQLASGNVCRVVSTQLVEAGVDFDFPVVYRALGGLDSMVQAAGRCNREGSPERGRVVIFVAPTQPPRGMPTQGMEKTMSLLREYGGSLDTTDVGIFETYFRMLYHTGNLDGANIQPLREQLNFATVGREFQLIEDGFTQTIVVPYGDAPIRIARVRRETALPQGPSKAAKRALQPFTIQIYPSAYANLDRAGALEEIVDGVFTLTAPYSNLYDSVYGLLSGDELKANPAALHV